MLYLYQTKTKTNIMTYQEFTKETLNYVTVRPTKDEMTFAYIVLFQGLGLSPKEAILESIKL